MKKIITLSVHLSVLLLSMSSLSYGQSANTSLSNLVAPTAVNQNLLPDANNNHNLGSLAKSWKNIYLSSSIFIDGSRFLSNGNSTSNVFVGNDAGITNTTAGFNTGVGHQSLYKNSSGFNNTAVGTFSLKGNLGGDNNTSMGVYSMENNTNGSGNSAFGDDVMSLNATGNNNVAVGISALGYNVGGSYNTAVGGYAGHYTGDNTYCTFLGYSADKFMSTNFTNSTALGAYTSISASNQVRIGSSFVTSIGGYTDWSNISDGRFKKNIKEDVPGLAFINKLKPVTYNLDVTGLKKFLGEDARSNDKQQSIGDEKIKQSIQKKEAETQTGFVAQDVEKAANELGYKFNGVDKPENQNTPYALRYAEFVVPLVKAVQELSKQNDEQKKINNDLREQISELKAMIANSNQSSTIANQHVISSAKLEQNQPNPTKQSTIIKYSIPQQTAKAAIKITNANGQEIKSINLSQKGNGEINLQTNDLTAGTYFYSLIVDGKMSDTKKMVITH